MEGIKHVPSEQRYRNAPITEALIDIQVELPSETPLSAIESAFHMVKEDYPTKKNRVVIEGQFSGGESVGASAKQKHVGFAFYSQDGKQIVQARLDGFTFNRLKPYGSWPELSNEAKRLWIVYRDAVRPIKMTRIAVRYINQLDVPWPFDDFKDYLRTVPEISTALPQTLSSFFMRLEFPQADFEGMLVLTQSSVPPPHSGLASFILDIDVIKENSNLTSDVEVWALIERLRIRKNEVFEGCITDKTRALFV
jgi:uncharacterized protein (TIGR04255 family)